MAAAALKTYFYGRRRTRLQASGNSPAPWSRRTRLRTRRIRARAHALLRSTVCSTTGWCVPSSLPLPPLVRRATSAPQNTAQHGDSTARASRAACLHFVQLTDETARGLRPRLTLTDWIARSPVLVPVPVLGRSRPSSRAPWRSGARFPRQSRPGLSQTDCVGGAWWGVYPSQTPRTKDGSPQRGAK